MESAEAWLKKLSDFTNALSLTGSRDTESCPKMKIAILDTGITKKYYDTFRTNIEEYKDFVSGEDDLQQDGTGHGSTALRLLMKLNYRVQVFVGRVFKSTNADDDTEQVMAKVGFWR